MHNRSDSACSLDCPDQQSNSTCGRHNGLHGEQVAQLLRLQVDGRQRKEAKEEKAQELERGGARTFDFVGDFGVQIGSKDRHEHKLNTLTTNP